MQIFIHLCSDVTGDITITLEVEPSDSIKDVEQKVFSKQGISVNYQRLYFAGIHLKNHKTLADYNIQKESTLELKIENPLDKMFCMGLLKVINN